MDREVVGGMEGGSRWRMGRTVMEMGDGVEGV